MVAVFGFVGGMVVVGLLVVVGVLDWLTMSLLRLRGLWLL